MNVLVTGSSGFVGTKLVKRNPNFIGLDRESGLTTNYVMSLSNEVEFLSVLKKENIDVIVHLAGAQYSHKIKRSIRDNFFEEGNRVITESLVSAAQKAKISHIIYISTDMVYGNQIESPISEDHLCLPLGPYGKSKLECEKIIVEKLQHSLVTIFRPRLILGTGRRGTINMLAKCISLKAPVPLIGAGQNRYQFIAVEDVCSAIEMAIDNKIQGYFNLGSDSPPTVECVITETLKSMNLKNKIIKTNPFLVKKILRVLDFLNISPLVPEQFEIADIDYVLSTERFKNASAWRPTIDDVTMLRNALNDII